METGLSGTLGEPNSSFDITQRDGGLHYHVEETVDRSSACSKTALLLIRLLFLPVFVGRKNMRQVSRTELYLEIIVFLFGGESGTSLISKQMRRPFMEINYFKGRILLIVISKQISKLFFYRLFCCRTHWGKANPFILPFRICHCSRF